MTGMKVTSASVSGSRLILAMLRLVSTHRSVTKCDTALRPYVTSCLRYEFGRDGGHAASLPSSSSCWCLPPGR